MMGAAHRVIWVRQGGQHERSIEVYRDGRLVDRRETGQRPGTQDVITLLDVARLNNHQAQDRNLVGEVLAALMSMQPAEGRPANSRRAGQCAVGRPAATGRAGGRAQ